MRKSFASTAERARGPGIGDSVCTRSDDEGGGTKRVGREQRDAEEGTATRVK